MRTVDLHDGLLAPLICALFRDASEAGYASVARELGANRVVRGVKIPHPCGDPMLDSAADRALRLGIVRAALDALTRPG